MACLLSQPLGLRLCLLLPKGKIFGDLLDLAMGTTLTLALHSFPAVSPIFNEMVGTGPSGLQVSLDCTDSRSL